MTREAVRAAIAEIGIIPAVRLTTAEDARFASEAIYSSGIPIVEVTMTVPGAVAVISQLAKQNSALVVGAGTVFDVGNSAAVSGCRRGVSHDSRVSTLKS